MSSASAISSSSSAAPPSAPPNPNLPAQPQKQAKKVPSPQANPPAAKTMVDYAFELKKYSCNLNKENATKEQLVQEAIKTIFLGVFCIATSVASVCAISAFGPGAACGLFIGTLLAGSFGSTNFTMKGLGDWERAEKTYARKVEDTKQLPDLLEEFNKKRASLKDPHDPLKGNKTFTIQTAKQARKYLKMYELSQHVEGLKKQHSGAQAQLHQEILSTQQKVKDMTAEVAQKAGEGPQKAALEIVLSRFEKMLKEKHTLTGLKAALKASKDQKAAQQDPEARKITKTERNWYRKWIEDQAQIDKLGSQITSIIKKLADYKTNPSTI